MKIERKRTGNNKKSNQKKEKKKKKRKVINKSIKLTEKLEEKQEKIEVPKKDSNEIFRSANLIRMEFLRTEIDGKCDFCTEK